MVACIEDVSEDVEIGTPETMVSWIEPTATDNSGSVNRASRSHSPGQLFAIGTTEVTYTFVDPSGNEASCTFSVIVNKGKYTSRFRPATRVSYYVVPLWLLQEVVPLRVLTHWEYWSVTSSNFLFCISAFSWRYFSRTWWKTLTHQIWHELVHGGPRYGRMNT